MAVWAGLSALSFVSTQVTDIAKSPTTQEQLQKLNGEIKELPKVKPLNCWLKVQNLMMVQPWVEHPFVDNLKGLKTACIEKTADTCNGADCTNNKSEPASSAESNWI